MVVVPETGVATSGVDGTGVGGTGVAGSGVDGMGVAGIGVAGTGVEATGIGAPGSPRIGGEVNGEVPTGVTTIDGISVNVGCVVGIEVGVESIDVGIGELEPPSTGGAIAVAGAAAASNGPNDPHTAITLTKSARITDTLKDVFRVLMRRTYQEGANATYRGETRGKD